MGVNEVDEQEKDENGYHIPAQPEPCTVGGSTSVYTVLSGGLSRVPR